MLIPCKNCIVKPMCSVDCSQYKKSIRFINEMVSCLSVLFSCIILIAIFYFLGGFSKEIIHLNSWGNIIWLVSSIFNIYYNKTSGLNISKIPLVLFAPVISLTFVQVWLASLYVKKVSKK
jgi:hypothetical protein